MPALGLLPWYCTCVGRSQLTISLSIGKDTNLGVGGWYDVGCLRYGFYPTLVKMGGSPPNATLFFDVGKYCG